VDGDLLRLREEIPGLQYHDLCALRDKIDQVLAISCMKRAAKAHKRAESYVKEWRKTARPWRFWRRWPARRRGKQDEQRTDL